MRGFYTASCSSPKRSKRMSELSAAAKIKTEFANPNQDVADEEVTFELQTPPQRERMTATVATETDLSPALFAARNIRRVCFVF